MLEGSVRKSGDKLRITAQLVRASDSSHLWSQTYDRQMTDMFEVQDEIAAAVVEQLKIKLLGEAPKTRATDPRPTRCSCRPARFGRQDTPEAFEQAIALYQAGARDRPDYAAAWDGLAGAYFNQVDYGCDRRRRGHPAGARGDEQGAGDRPGLCTGARPPALDRVYYDGDLAAAARHFEQALALEPANPDIIWRPRAWRARLGRLDQAIALGEYAVSRDPVNVDGHDEPGLCLPLRRAPGRGHRASSARRST